MNYSFLIYIGMACALCISAVGSGFGAGMASLASVGGWKKCYANGKQDPFILVGFAGAPLTQIIYGFLLMNFISAKLSDPFHFCRTSCWRCHRPLCFLPG